MSDYLHIEIISLPSETTSEYNFKTVIIGEPGVGKSSIISRGVNNIFTKDYKATLFFDHSWKNYKVNNSKIRIQLCDTCGQEVYHSVIKNFYKSALCIFLVFSINNIESFNSLSFWINEIEQSSSEDIIIFLVGNKKDIEKERVVTEQQINDFIHENKIKFYFETSAATGENVDKLFEETVKQLYIKHVIPLIKNVNNVSLYSTDDNFVLSDSNKIDNDMVVIQEDNDEKCQNCVC